MLGAICGDMVGAPYEFDLSPKKKDFGPLFTDDTWYTDDSVMTTAVAEALMAVGKEENESIIKTVLIVSLKKWGAMEPDAGYGGRFIQWLFSEDAHPYNSWGNGSAMRVSPAGWLYDTIEKTRKMARYTAEITHNHPNGVKGAESVAAAIFMARKGKSKEEIKEYIVKEFGYDLSRTCDEIRPKYRHDESCEGTVPEAFAAFLEGTDFEDVIRLAVSLGGDCDTLTCIAGSMAEAFYGIPDVIEDEVIQRMSPAMFEIYNRFEGCKINGLNTSSEAEEYLKSSDVEVKSDSNRKNARKKNRLWFLKRLFKK